MLTSHLLGTLSPLAMDGDDVWFIVMIVGLLVVLALLIIFLKFFKLWIQAYFSNANISLFELVGMWLRKVSATTIVQSKIAARSGVDSGPDEGPRGALPRGPATSRRSRAR